MSDGTTITEEHVHEERHTVETILGGIIGGGIIAIAGVILAIIGLSGMEPRWLLGAATIAVGISFLIEGAAIATRLSDLLHESTEGRVQMSELGAGVTGETLAGIVGVVLGILGILNVAPLSLLPIAAIIYGAALILGAGANVRLSEITFAQRIAVDSCNVIRQAVLATTGFQIPGRAGRCHAGDHRSGQDLSSHSVLGGHAGHRGLIPAEQCRHCQQNDGDPAAVLK